MALANDSDDEWMADDEFDDFEISEEDLFFYEQDKNKPNKELTDILKLLRISQSPKPLAHYSYDELYDFCNAASSSDNDAGTAAILMNSESKSDIEINLYWLKVTIDKLQDLGKGIEIIYPDTDSSLPDLIELSDTKDSIIFKLTKSDETNSDQEMGEATMVVKSAMVANTERNNKEVQTELYRQMQNCL